MNLDLLVLDWSGVVSHDFELVLTSVNEIMAHFGRPLVSEQELRTDFRPKMEAFYADRGVSDYEAVRRMHGAFFKRDASMPTAIPGAPEAVRELARHAPVAVFSSHPEEALLRDIWRYGLQECISHVVGGADKSNTIDFKYLLEFANISPKSRILYAGDTTIDLNLAHLAGARSVAVVHPDYGYQLREQVERFRPQPTDGIITHVHELLPVIKNGF